MEQDEGQQPAQASPPPAANSKKQPTCQVCQVDLADQRVFFRVSERARGGPTRSPRPGPPPAPLAHELAGARAGAQRSAVSGWPPPPPVPPPSTPRSSRSRGQRAAWPPRPTAGQVLLCIVLTKCSNSFAPRPTCVQRYKVCTRQLAPAAAAVFAAARNRGGGSTRLGQPRRAPQLASWRAVPSCSVARMAGAAAHRRLGCLVALAASSSHRPSPSTPLRSAQST